MTHRSILVSLAGVMLVACGGEAASAPPPAANPPAPTAVAAAPTPSSTGGSAEAATPPPVAPKAPMNELQKKTLDAFYAAFNAHDAAKCAAAYAADATMTESAPMGGTVDHKGRDEIQKTFAGIFADFPDAKVAGPRHLSVKNTVIEEFVFAGTNTGTNGSMPATKKPVGVMAAAVQTYGDDGLIATERVYMDSGTMAGQLGFSPKKVRPVAQLPTGDDWVVAKGDDGEKKNADMIAKSFEAMNAHDAKAASAFMATDSVEMDSSMPEDVKGPKASEKGMGNLFKTFPDVKLAADNVYAAGDWVAIDGTFTGTQKGQMGPFKPTQKAVNVKFVELNRVKDGKVVEVHRYYSSTDMMAQLGLMPKPKDAKPAADKAADKKADGKPTDKAAEKPAEKKPAPTK